DHTWNEGIRADLAKTIQEIPTLYYRHVTSSVGVPFNSNNFGVALWPQMSAPITSHTYSGVFSAQIFIRVAQERPSISKRYRKLKLRKINRLRHHVQSVLRKANKHGKAEQGGAGEPRLSRS